MKFINLTFIIFLFLLFSCKKDDVNTETEIENKYLISNEGNFGSSNASVSIFDPEENSIENNVFFNINDVMLGDVLQSIGKADSQYYFLLNSSNKIVITDDELNHKKSINIELPRYFEYVGDNKALITSWSEGGKIYLLNTNSNEITDSIITGTGPEKMITKADFTYIVNAGGYGSDSTISIINNQDFTIEKIISTHKNPSDIVYARNKLWCLCSGLPIYDANWQIIGHKPSYIISIDLFSKTVENEYLLGDYHPKHIEVDAMRDFLFVGSGFGGGGIYKISLDNMIIPNGFFIDEEFYGFNINPEDGNIYCLSSPSFTSAGKLKIFNINGYLDSEHLCGIGPNGVLF